MVAEWTLIGEKTSESEIERQQVHKWVEQSRQQKEREELERKEAERMKAKRQEKQQAEKQKIEKQLSENGRGLNETGKKIMEGRKFSEFCKFIDSAPARTILEIGKRNQSIYILYDTHEIHIVADTACGCWKVEKPKGGFMVKTFFDVNSGEREWTKEEFDIVVDLVNACINQLSLGLVKSNEKKTGSYLCDFYGSLCHNRDVVPLFSLPLPSTPVSVKAPY